MIYKHFSIHYYMVKAVLNNKLSLIFTKKSPRVSLNFCLFPNEIIYHSFVYSSMGFQDTEHRFLLREFLHFPRVCCELMDVLQ